MSTRLALSAHRNHITQKLRLMSLALQYDALLEKVVDLLARAKCVPCGQLSGTIASSIVRARRKLSVGIC